MLKILFWGFEFGIDYTKPRGMFFLSQIFWRQTEKSPVTIDLGRQAAQKATQAMNTVQ